MNDLDCVRSCYRQIAVLNREHRVWLVQHENSGKVYVEKKLYNYNMDIYLQLLEHPIPGLPQIVDLAEEAETLYVIEEYIPGPTLQERLDQQGPLPEGEVRDIIHQLCQIVSNLHQSNPPIIHRDIKPSNIVLDSSRKVRLLDMNAARLFCSTKAEDTTLMGTAGFAAPEQYGFAESSVQTDVYAMGILLNVLLTGALPREQTVTGPLAAVVQRCIRLEPQQRYPSVEALDRALSDTPAPAPVPPPPDTAEPVNAPVDRRPSLLPPGFRSGRAGHMVPAAVLYGLVLYIVLHYQLEGGADRAALYTHRAVFALLFYGMILFSGNYLNIHQRLPLTKSPFIPLRLLGVLLGNALLFALTVLLLALLCPV